MLHIFCAHRLWAIEQLKLFGGSPGILRRDGMLRRCFEKQLPVHDTTQAWAAQAEQPWLCVCKPCLCELAAGRVPKESLVCVDAGSTAISKHDGTPLPPLTLVETVFLGSNF